MQSNCNTRTRCLGIISGRTATFLIAIGGCFAHLQTFSYLGILRDSFPQVPKARMSMFSQHAVNVASLYPSSTAVEPLHQIGDIQISQEMKTFDPDINYASTSVSPSSPTSSFSEPSKASTSNDDFVTESSRWFNLLPKTPTAYADAQDQAVWSALEESQDEERRSWEAAGKLTSAMRAYALICVVACILGAYGVLRVSKNLERLDQVDMNNFQNNLVFLKLFVLSSVFDMLLFALTVISLGIIVTYPDIRTLLCEQIASGEVHSFLAYMRGANKGTARPSPADDFSFSGSTAPTLSSAITKMPTTSLLSRAAGGFWKRALTQDDAAAPSIYWWDNMLDNMLENESCDDVFSSFIVPFGLLICLVYLAIR